MEILIEDIPEEGLTINADSTTAPWLSSVLKEVIGNRFTDKDKAELAVTLIKYDGNVDITGELEITSHPECDRCLKVYEEKETIPFHVLMAPLYESRQQQKEEEKDDMEKELVKEDMEFSFYEGDRIGMDEIVKEQMLLMEPFKHLCKEDCKGICQRCGKDLNLGPCGCKEEHRDARWDALKNFKPAKPAKKKRATKR